MSRSASDSHTRATRISHVQVRMLTMSFSAWALWYLVPASILVKSPFSYSPPSRLPFLRPPSLRILYPHLNSNTRVRVRTIHSHHSAQRVRIRSSHTLIEWLATDVSNDRYPQPWCANWTLVPTATHLLGVIQDVMRTSGFPTTDKHPRTGFRSTVGRSQRSPVRNIRLAYVRSCRRRLWLRTHVVPARRTAC
jgi:hypothetical protein